MNSAILPLAFTMVAGPQILSAIILVTREKDPTNASLAYIAGVLSAATVGVSVAYIVVRFLGYSGNPGGDASRHWLEITLVVLLILLSLYSYVTRETSKPPSWLAGLQSAEPSRIFITGLLLIFIMPTDILVMLTVASNLSRSNSSLIDAVPFLLLTALFVALPLLFYKLFNKRAIALMPKVRDWMTSHSWLINIFIYILFIFIIL